MHGRATTIPTVDDPTPTIDTNTPIKRVIYVMLENRSFNNLFGHFPGVKRHRRSASSTARRSRLIACPEWLPGDLPARPCRLPQLRERRQAWTGSATGSSVPPTRTPSFDEHADPQLLACGPASTRCRDNFFASAAGPSYANHYYFIAGQSGGVIDNPENIGTRVERRRRPFKSWGCDAIGDDVFVFVKDDKGNLTKHDTCFTFPTVGEQLGEIGVDWTFYSAVPGQSGYFWNAYNGISNVFHTDHVARSTSARSTTS